MLYQKFGTIYGILGRENCLEVSVENVLDYIERARLHCRECGFYSKTQYLYKGL